MPKNWIQKYQGGQQIAYLQPPTLNTKIDMEKITGNLKKQMDASLAKDWSKFASKNQVAGALTGLKGGLASMGNNLLGAAPELVESGMNMVGVKQADDIGVGDQALQGISSLAWQGAIKSGNPWLIGGAGVLKGVDLLNRYAGSTTKKQGTLGIDTGGYASLINTKANRKQTMFSSGKGRMQRLNSLTDYYNAQNLKAADINYDEQQNNLAAANSVQDIASKNQQALFGGINTRMLTAKKGAKIAPAHLRTLAKKAKRGTKLQKASFENWYNTVPKDRNDTTSYNLRRAYELASKDELEKWRTATPEQLKDSTYHLKTFYWNKNGVGEFVKSKHHSTVKKELNWYDSNEAKDFRTKYKLYDDGSDYYQYRPVEKFAEGGSLLPNWGKVKAALNPYNWGVANYSDKGDFGTAYSTARKAGEKEFMWNGKRYNTNKDTDPLIKNPKNEDEVTLNNYYKEYYPEFIKNYNRNRPNVKINSVGLNSPLKSKSFRASYNPISKSLNIQDYSDTTGDFIAELAHHKQKYGLKKGIKYISELLKYGDYRRYDVEGTDEYNVHRLIEPALYMQRDGNFSKEDILKLQKYLKVKEDGILGKDTYKAIVDKYYNKDIIKGYVNTPSFNDLSEEFKDKIINQKYPDTYDNTMSGFYLYEIGEDPNINLKGLTHNKEYYYGEDDNWKGAYFDDNQLLKLNPNNKTFDTLALQKELSNRGYKLPKSIKEDGSFDGIWGDETKQALIDWQTKNKTNVETLPVMKNYAEGGKLNVIPDGALHARKHTLPEEIAENVTNKGIPVITYEEGGDIKQHAEIERNEIIFNKETTTKLEDLFKKYNDTESEEEKDKLAIEAGKFLTSEILENTDDRTGLLNEVE